MKIRELLKKPIINKKRLLIVLVAFVLLVAMVISNPEVWKYLFGQEPIKITFQSGVQYTPVMYGKEVLLVSNDGVRAISKAGKDTWSTVHAINSPMTVVKKNYVMVADINGTSVNVYKKDKTVSQIRTEREILTAKVNKNGYVAVATEELGYKGAVHIFKKDGQKMFKWYSGNGYIGDIDIAPNNKTLAVAQLMADRDEIYSRVLLVNTKKEEEAQQIAEIEGIVMRLRYKDNGELLVVSEKGIYGYKKNGNQYMSIDFGGRIPVAFNVENDGNMVVAFSNGLNNTVLESYNAKGKLRGSYEANGEIRAFDVNGECILAATVSGVTRIAPDGKVKGQMAVSHDVKALKIFAGRDRFFSLGGGSAEIIRIK